MPGTYAHITLVNLLTAMAARREIPGLSPEASAAVMDYLKFVEMGANSPDYPYLAVGDKESNKWADLMHYTKTGSIIHVGIEMTRDLMGEQRRKCAAWLLGYTAHFTMDVCIHPVINLKVGPYAQNKTAHRVCEMNQDVYIFQRMNLGGIDLAEHLAGGIGACSSPASNEKLDPDIAKPWEDILEAVHPAQYDTNAPNVDKWHAWFNRLVDDIAEEGNRLIPLARHVAAGLALMYPLPSEVKRDYINALGTPTMGTLSYDQIFDKALGHVAEIWGIVARGIFEQDRQYQTSIGDWNLDTGMDPSGKLVFWS